MKIIVHAGADTVGGICIEVATETTRLLLDFGAPLFKADRTAIPSDAWYRKPTGQLVAAGLMPDFTELFLDERPMDAVIVSHAHLDHTGYLNRVPEEVPIYATSGTSKMLLAGMLFANQPRLPKRRLTSKRARETFQVGDVGVTLVPVDHSIFGSCGILLESPDETIFYTGDLRLHGLDGGRIIERLNTLLNGRTLDVLICEGTHDGLPDETTATEPELRSEIHDAVRQADGLVLVSQSPQHVDRLLSVIHAATENGRLLVVDPYTAFVLYTVSSELSDAIPSANLRLYCPRVMRAKYERMAWLHPKLRTIVPQTASIDEVCSDPSRYVMIYRGSILEDFKEGFPGNTLCLFSRWAGYRQSSSWETSQTRIEATGGTVRLLHSTGHIRSHDIDRLVAAWTPQQIMPVHTFEPHALLRRASVAAETESER